MHDGANFVDGPGDDLPRPGPMVEPEAEPPRPQGRTGTLGDTGLARGITPGTESGAARQPGRQPALQLLEVAVAHIPAIVLEIVPLRKALGFLHAPGPWADSSPRHRCEIQRRTELGLDEL